MTKSLIAAITILCCAIASTAELADPFAKWEKEITAIEARLAKDPPGQGSVVFAGSSSIRLWDLKKSFPGVPAVNVGFGGSCVADSVHFAERIILPLKPRAIVFYAGDNDLATGKSPEQVADDYAALVAKVHAALPQTKLVYIAIKPSRARWKLYEKMQDANARIAKRAVDDPQQAFVDIGPAMLGEDGQPRAELLQADGLHLTAEGYKIWTELVAPHLLESGTK